MGDHANRAARLRVLLLIVVVFAALAVFLWWRVHRSRTANAVTSIGQGQSSGGSTSSSSPTTSISPALSPTAEISPGSPAPASSESPGPLPSPSPAVEPVSTNLTFSENYVGTVKLIIPVVGVRPDQLLDTFADARSEGRVHDAIDIPAAAGTQVVAAADGEIIKLFLSERGGITIYQLSPDKKLVFYYAHLQRYADGLVAGRFVRQGEVIGFVGDTGNAGAGNYHLHFSISVIADPKRYWEGTNINPYPLLHK